MRHLHARPRRTRRRTPRRGRRHRLWRREPSRRRRFGPPIVVDAADLEKWVWVGVPEMRCADDSEGGFAVNFTSRSRDLVVYLLGGGVCYDLFTCTVDQPLLHGLGDDPLRFLFGAGEGRNTGIFDRSDPANPFRDSNFVVLPHCTGDGHTANKVSTYPPLAPVHQVGYANVTAAIRRIVPTFRDASRVVFAGFSAGGIGVTFNYHQFASAFESVGQPPPHADRRRRADPAPALPVAARAGRAARGLGLRRHPGRVVPACLTEGLHEVHRRLAELHPGMRSSVVCATSDVVVFGLYAILNGGTSSLEDGLARPVRLDRELPDGGRSEPTARVLLPGRPARGDGGRAARRDTPGLASFLQQQVDDAAAWENVRR